MKKVVTLLLVLAVMFSCLPLGMVSYAEDAYTRPEFSGMQWLDPTNLGKFGINESRDWKAGQVFDGVYGQVYGGSNNFYENETRNGSGAVGLDLGEGNVQFVRKIRYLPRYNFADRLNGAVFEGSNSAKDAADYKPITKPLSGHGYKNNDLKNDRGQTGGEDHPNGWFEIDADTGYNAYRYLRLGRTNEEKATALNVTEIEFYVATGADYIASRAAYEISKEVKTPGNSSQAVVKIPALSVEEAANYNASFEVMEGEAVIDTVAGTITYTPSAAEDLTAKIKVAVTNKSNPSDSRTFEIPVTIKRQAKNMTKVNANMFQDTFSSSGGVDQRWIVDGNLGEIDGQDRNIFEDSNKTRDHYVGIDLTMRDGNDKKFIRKIRYLPRYNYADRLLGAVFQGSNAVKTEGETDNNAPRHYDEYENITEPLSGHVKSVDKNINGGPNGWFEIDLFDNIDAYKYIRLWRSKELVNNMPNNAGNGALNVTEIELYMASGADHIASLVASRIGKVIPRPADGSSVTEKTVTDLKAGTDGYTVTYTAEGDGVSIDTANKITFTHSDKADSKAMITVTATSDDGTDTRTIALPVTIKQNIDEAGMLDYDKEQIDAAFKAAAGAESHVISGYMDLPTETKYGSTVTWAVSGDDVDKVTLENNRLTSKDKDKTTASVTLAATVKLGETSETLAYNVTVNSGLQVQYKFGAESVDEAAGTVKNTGFNINIGTATFEKGATALTDAGAVYLKRLKNRNNTAHVKMPKDIVANITGDYTFSITMYNDNADGWPFYIGNSSQGSNTPWFGIQYTGKYIFDSTGNKRDGEYQIDPNVGNNRYSGQWTNIVLSYSGETMTMYVNGENKGSVNIPYKLSEKFSNQQGDSWNLLGATGWDNGGFNGLITDFRIYSRALSAEEAKAVSDSKPAISNYAEWKAVAECKNALTLEKTTGVKQDITLPAPPEGNTSTVSWKSSDTSVISDNGVIKKNADGGETATLTATIKNGAASTTKEFNITLGKGGNAEKLAEADLAWLNAYNFNEHTVEGEDYIIMTLPVAAPNESVLTWTYDKKGIGDDGSALTKNDDGTVRLFVWKSGFEALNGTLAATITNTINAEGNPATKEYTKNVTADKLDKIFIPVSAEAVSGSAEINSTRGLLTTKSGKIYLKFDVSGVQNKIGTDKQITKAELQVHTSISREPSPVIIREVENGDWNHGDKLGTEGGTPVPGDVEPAYVGNGIMRYQTGRYDITHALLTGFGSDTTAYTLSITNNSNKPNDWPDNNTGIVSKNNEKEPQNWARLVLTLANSGKENVPEEYTKINGAEYTTAITELASKTLAVGASTALPEPPSVMVPNPAYGTEDAAEDTPKTIESKGSWYASNATINGNSMTITNKDEDVILGLWLNGYVKCFTLAHDKFVDYQYQKEDVENGIKLKKADNAGNAFLYTAVYEGNRVVSVICTNLSDATWTNNTYAVAAPSGVLQNQTVKYYLWNKNLTPYLPSF